MLTFRNAWRSVWFQISGLSLVAWLYIAIAVGNAGVALAAWSDTESRVTHAAMAAAVGIALWVVLWLAGDAIAVLARFAWADTALGVLYILVACLAGWATAAEGWLGMTFTETCVLAVTFGWSLILGLGHFLEALDDMQLRKHYRR